METVLAGSPRFVSLLAEGVRARAGADPRVAADPHEAFILCSDAGGLLVAECGGPEWIPVVRDLRSLCGQEIAVVLAVPPGLPGQISRLQHAGADEVVAWDGRPEVVAWAVDRVLNDRGVRAIPPPMPSLVTGPTNFGTATPPPVLSRAPAAAPAVPAAAPVAPVTAAIPLAPAAFTIRELPEGGSAGASPAAWPAGVLDATAAERLLADSVAGAPPGIGPAAERAARLVGYFGEMERAAFAGEAIPIDAGLVRRLAALRLRASTAAGTAPPVGSPHDAAAVQSLLAEIDGALAALKSATEGLAPGGLVEAEELRNALVKEAIDLTEAVNRLAPAGSVAEAGAVRAATARAPATRLLSNRTGEAVEERPRAARGWWIVLGLAAAGAAAFHGRALLDKKPAVAPPTMSGAPSGTVAVRDRGVAIVAREPGRALDPAQVEAFKSKEAARGQVVREVAPGVFISVPEPPKQEARP